MPLLYCMAFRVGGVKWVYVKWGLHAISPSATSVLWMYWLVPSLDFGLTFFQSGVQWTHCIDQACCWWGWGDWQGEMVSDGSEGKISALVQVCCMTLIQHTSPNCVSACNLIVLIEHIRKQKQKKKWKTKQTLHLHESEHLILPMRLKPIFKHEQKSFVLL